MQYKIREMKKTEFHLLEDFLYEAIFQRDEKNIVPRNIIKQPEINVFIDIDGFGKKDDLCFVAESSGKIIGAVWTRILSREIKGFGNINSETPEFAISIFKEYRGSGIGTALMKKMLFALKSKDYKQASLAVQKDNYAVKMYERVGFKTIKETSEEFVMICKLK